MTARIAVPSKGRLRESVLDLLISAGYKVSAFGGSGASTVLDGIEFIEMRPRDAAAWLAAGRLDAGFVSTDTALENGIEDWNHIELGFSRSDLVLACRVDAPFASAADLAGRTVATHLPNWTRRWFAEMGIKVDVVAMGGSLEGICARGMADAIVDLRETGFSLVRNSLHAIEVAHSCQAIFAMAPGDGAVLDAAGLDAAAPGTGAPDNAVAANAHVADLALRIDAARAARRMQYLMLHIAAEKVDELGTVFPGLASPTVLPLAGRDDLVAAHMVVERAQLWARLGDLQQLGATGIVALPTDAILK